MRYGQYLTSWRRVGCALVRIGLRLRPIDPAEPTLGAPHAFTANMWSVIPDDEQYGIYIVGLPSPNGSPITDLEYREDGGSWTSLGSTALGEHVLIGKTNGIQYSVEIRAVNAQGNGNTSDLKSVIPASVPDPFTAGMWSLQGVDSAYTISIESLPDNGGALIVALQYREDGGDWTALEGTGPGDRLLTGKTNGVAYEVELRLTNSVGAGTASDLKVVTPAAVPGVFTDNMWALSSGDEAYTIHVSTLPDSGGSAITALQYREDGGTWTALSGTGTGDRVLTSKVNGLGYDVELRAVNALGNGPNSDVKSVTPVTVPDAFTVGMWSLSAGDELYTIHVTSLPDSGGASLTAVQYREDGGAWVALTGTGTGDRVITGRVNDTEYDVELRAVSAIGASAASDLKSITPTSGSVTPPEWLLALDPTAVAGWDFRTDSTYGLGASAFARTGEALMKNAAGKWQAFAANTLRRIEGVGCQLEVARTNKVVWNNHNAAGPTYDNLEKQGNSAATLLVVNAQHPDYAAVQAALAASELQDVVSTVYCLDNNQGGSGNAFAAMVSTGDTAQIVVELWAWYALPGNYKMWNLGSPQGSYIALPSAPTRRVTAFTPGSSTEFMQIGASPVGTKMYFCFGQISVGSNTAQTPIRTPGGAAVTRGADVLPINPVVTDTAYDWYALFDDNSTQKILENQLDGFNINPANLNRSIVKAVYAVPYVEGGGGDPEVFTPAYFIGPASAGTGDGSSWANRAALSSLNAGIAAAAAGNGVIGIALHLGHYTQQTALSLTNSGTQTKPILIVGLNADGTLGDKSAGKIIGKRQAWTSPASFQATDCSGWTDGNGLIGNTIIALGATSWLRFRNLWFERGKDCVTITSGHDHDFIDCTWYNNQSAIYAGNGSSAYNVRMYRPDVIGISKEIVRMWGTTHDFYIEDPQWDCRWQDKVAHARGLFLDQNAHHATIQSGITRDGWIDNAFFSTKDINGFRQGEAVCGEELNHHITVKGTAASYLLIRGCTDAAFDVKSADVTIEYVRCINNKRGFRMWGRPNVNIRNCEIIDPSIYSAFNGDENGFILFTWMGCFGGQQTHINYDNLLLQGGTVSGMNLFNVYSAAFVSGSSVTSINTRYANLPPNYVLKSGPSGAVFNISPDPS